MTNSIAIQFLNLAAPTGAPQEFQVDAINTTAIEVQWELPPIYTFGGVILGYKLFVQPANGEERVINIQDNETNVYTVGELEPATPYSFSILAYNTIGDGPRTTTLTISTLSKQVPLLKSVVVASVKCSKHSI